MIGQLTARTSTAWKAVRMNRHRGCENATSRTD
jgi:hypothetical protein